MSDRVSILVIGYRKFSELINVLLPEFEQEADITIVESVASESTDYAKLVERHSPATVVSAGSNAAYLSSTLNVPVVLQPVTDTDVIEALGKARRVASRVHVFTYAGQPGLSKRLFASLPDLTDIEVIHRSYGTADEAKEAFLIAMAAESPQVIVGPSHICRLAEQRGCPAILVYSRESARAMLRTAIDTAANAQQVRAAAKGGRDQSFIIHSPQMERVAQLVRNYAGGRAAVLLEGESGTGKEHIAREIHRLGDFADGPLVAINCGSIPNELFESELFGYAEGAFTSSRRGGRIGLMQQANGGLLFLDEIGELPLQQQVKLLRALQERRVRPVGSEREVAIDFKLVAATNRDLSRAVLLGEFRDDLYYRLNVFNLRLPPLRDRLEDVSAIARYYLIHYAAEYAVTVDIDQLMAVVEPLFARYSWPGNIRELQNFVERLVVNCRESTNARLSASTVLEILPELARPFPTETTGALKELEASAIMTAMEKFGGDKQRVANHLGISVTTLWRRLKRMEEKDPGEAARH